MLQVEIREALISHVKEPFKAAFPDVAIVYPGEPFDWNNPPSIFVEFEIDFVDGKQITLAADPKARFIGYVYATVSMKQGQGTKRVLQITDWFNAHLGFARLGKLEVFEPQPNTPAKSQGWHSEQAKFYFHANP